MMAPSSQSQRSAVFIIDTNGARPEHATRGRLSTPAAPTDRHRPAATTARQPPDLLEKSRPSCLPQVDPLNARGRTTRAPTSPSADRRNELNYARRWERGQTYPDWLAD